MRRSRLFWYVFHPGLIAAMNPGLFHIVNLGALVIGNTVFVGAGIIGALKRRYYKLLPAALAMPAYWLMMSIAAYKALWQLITKPFYWEKTSHGLSTTTPHPSLPATERGQ